MLGSDFISAKVRNALEQANQKPFVPALREAYRDGFL
jgi:hypothetical protein